MRRGKSNVAQIQKKVLNNACSVLERIVGKDVRSMIKNVSQTETEIVFLFKGDIGEHELETFGQKTGATWRVETVPGIGTCIQISISYKELSGSFMGGMGFFTKFLILLFLCCISFLLAYFTSPVELVPFLLGNQ